MDRKQGKNHYGAFYNVTAKEFMNKSSLWEELLGYFLNAYPQS